MEDRERQREGGGRERGGGERYNILYVLATYPAHRVVPSTWR